MVTIITGEKNIGKTTFLMHWYAKTDGGIGFCSQKVLNNGILSGYDLLFLPDKTAIPFIRLATPADRDDPDKIIRNRFAFSRTAISEALQRIKPDKTAPSVPVWIDEMGALELSGDGFDALFRLALSHFDDIRVVFRKRCLEELIKHYDLEDYQVIRL